jgi:hypothetical protein
MCRIWHAEGVQVGCLDLNRAAGNEPVAWAFKPTNKIEERSEQHTLTDLWDDEASQAVEQKIKAMKAGGVHFGGGPEGGGVGGRRGAGGGVARAMKNSRVSRVHRVTTWNRSAPRKSVLKGMARAQQDVLRGRASPADDEEEEEEEEEEELLTQEAKSEKHWDGLMESMQIFSTALQLHTKERSEKEEERLRKVRVERGGRPATGKRWRMTPQLDPNQPAFGAAGGATVPRQYDLMRPSTSPEKGPARLFARRGGAGGDAGGGAGGGGGGRGTRGGGGGGGRPSTALPAVSVRLQHLNF